MDSLASPLVLTKLRVPAMRPRSISRRLLAERLAASPQARLILICAPAGYGKTTLLAQWARRLQADGIAVAWYALEANDDAPLPFASYLVASLLQALGPNAGLAQTAQLLRASSEIDLPRVLSSVINALLAQETPCLLVLDDYHLITAPAIHSGLTFLLEHLPANLSVAIGSRLDPPLPLARLRARGQMVEVRADSLYFTLDESERFLGEVMGLNLSPENVAVLNARTEGWAAGLQLAALTLAGRPDPESYLSTFSGSHRYLTDYLLEEVFNRLTAEEQVFLLATSTLERMCGPLCDALIGAAQTGEGRLQQLERANLFVISLDESGTWYRYHHLFRDFLQARLLKEQPQRAATLHLAASEWYEHNGYLREAVQHAVQAASFSKDWEPAAALVEMHSFTMMIHSEMATIAEWCAAFPEEVLLAHPLLAIMQSWVLVFSFRRQNKARVESLLEHVERAATGLADLEQGRTLLEHAAVVRTFLAMAPDPQIDLQQQLAQAEQMLNSYPHEDAGQFSGFLVVGYAQMALQEMEAARRSLETAFQVAVNGRLYYGMVESSFNLARLAHAQGELRRAAEICQQSQASVQALLTNPEQELPALGCLEIALGCVLFEQNRLEAAEQKLVHGFERIGSGMNNYYPLIACLMLARLREIQGRPAEAETYLAWLEGVCPDFSFCTEAARVMAALHLAPGEARTLAHARRFCQSFSPAQGDEVHLPGIGPIGAAEAYYPAYLAWGYAQIATGQAAAIWPYLSRQLARAEAQNLNARVIELRLLSAQARQAGGDHPGALDDLERALAASQAEDFVRSFDQGPAIQTLLAESARQGSFRDEARRILAAIAYRGAGWDESPAGDQATTWGEKLSERELETLRWMARGASNQAIAAQLVITVGTVKSHINHILRKLEAANRTEAVARARQAGLIPDEQERRG